MCATPPTCIHHHHYLWVNMMTPVLTLNFTGGGDDDERQSMKWILHPQKGFFCPRERKKSDWILICWVREAKSFSSSKYEILVSPSARYSIEGGKKKSCRIQWHPHFFSSSSSLWITHRNSSQQNYTHFSLTLFRRGWADTKEPEGTERERGICMCAWPVEKIRPAWGGTRVFTNVSLQDTFLLHHHHLGVSGCRKHVRPCVCVLEQSNPILRQLF